MHIISKNNYLIYVVVAVWILESEASKNDHMEFY